jgi:branched-chain amino acid transport system permease protein
MITWPNFVSQLFNGLALGALLALISSGLTIIYGTLGVLNLAHGAMFMLGGYAGYVAYEATGSFIVAVIAGSLFLVLVGGIMERLIIRHFYDRPIEDQLLVTFGLAICFVEVFVFSSAAFRRLCRRRLRSRASLRSVSCFIRPIGWPLSASSLWRC